MTIRIPQKNRIFGILLAMLFFLVPLDYVFPHIGNATLITVTSIIIILYGLFAVITGTKKIILYKETKLLVFLIFVYLISALWAIDNSAALSRMVPVLNTVLLYIIATQFDLDKKYIRLLENASILGAFALSLYVLRFVDLGLVFAGYRLKFNLIGGSYFSDPNGLAGRILLPLIILINRVQQKQKLYKRIIYIIMLLMVSYILLLTGSRAGILAILLGIITLFILGFKKKEKWVLISLFLFILVVYLALRFLPEHIVNRIFNIEKYNEVSVLEGDRIDIWKHVLFDLFYKSPILGYGGGNAPNALKEIYGYGKAVHSSYLNVLCELGLIGFIPWMMFVFKKVKTAFKLRNINPMIFAATVSIIFMAATLDAFTEKYLWSIFIYLHLYNKYAVGEYETEKGDKENDKIESGLPRIRHGRQESVEQD